ncbi:hypothetical protein ACYFX5_08610 [Bremerella sp. T1]|uniref:hypothetical protein n=1 Tax=Bremerella sp. TYQ1 TaxID=3119568 RepID=UPI001CCE255A|nr:hypothetical protein [Bremerella volcania]UBM38317.1 hypothetical protein LA756_10535 [Bremerella volcania]
MPSDRVNPFESPAPTSAELEESPITELFEYSFTPTTEADVREAAPSLSFRAAVAWAILKSTLTAAIAAASSLFLIYFVSLFFFGTALSLSTVTLGSFFAVVIHVLSLWGQPQTYNCELYKQLRQSLDARQLPNNVRDSDPYFCVIEHFTGRSTWPTAKTAVDAGNLYACPTELVLETSHISYHIPISAIAACQRVDFRRGLKYVPMIGISFITPSGQKSLVLRVAYLPNQRRSRLTRLLRNCGPTPAGAEDLCRKIITWCEQVHSENHSDSAPPG